MYMAYLSINYLIFKKDVHQDEQSFQQVTVATLKNQYSKLKDSPTHDDKHFEIPVVSFSADAISQI